MNTHKEIFSVKNYEIDHNGFFKPYSFLNHAQEMANTHAHSLGFGYDNLISSGIVWVLSRFHIKFQRLPLWKEELTMETWHKGNDRLFGFRDYSVTDSSGKEIIAATSSWLIIDYKTRKLQRMGNVLGDQFNGLHQKDAIKEPAGKIVMPSQMRHSGNKIVSISDIDINHHTNNARYFEWAMDSIDPQISKGIQIKELWITFNNESLLGENIDLYLSTQETDYQELGTQSLPQQNTFIKEITKEIYVEGKRGGCSIFQVKMKVSKL